jgi:hypothetical protein
VPAARGEQAIAGLEWAPAAGARVGLQLFWRDQRGLVLVAPVEGGPFATAGFDAGTAAARGLALDAALAGARYGVVASWSWQRVRVRSGDGRSWLPAYAGGAHALDAGVVLYPEAAISARLSVSARAGRRATSVSGAFEWEACNLLDRGCEFAGSPRADPQALGAVALPAYVRVDVGLRRHWHLRAGRRDAGVTLFATVANVLARSNVLTYATHPETGALDPVEMLPRAPLVVGIEAWF